MRNETKKKSELKKVQVYLYFKMNPLFNYVFLQMKTRMHEKDRAKA